MLTALGISRTHVTSLIEEFRYPRLGPGQMWEAFAERVEAGGVPIALEHRCVRIDHDNGIVSRIVFETPVGELEHEVDGVLSSMPLSELVLALEPAPPAEVVAAARRLRYRDLCLVGLSPTTPSRSRTTGSTSTTRESARAACRTSAPGARG